MSFRSWVRPWMVWVIGYPLFLFDRIVDAHFNAKADVYDEISKIQK